MEAPFQTHVRRLSWSMMASASPSRTTPQIRPIVGTEPGCVVRLYRARAALNRSSHAGIEFSPGHAQRQEMLGALTWSSSAEASCAKHGPEATSVAPRPAMAPIVAAAALTSPPAARWFQISRHTH